MPLIKFIKLLFTPLLSLLNLSNLLNLKKIFPSPKRISNTYEQSKLVIKNLDFLTKPFRLFYTFITLLFGQIYNIIRIGFHNIRLYKIDNVKRKEYKSNYSIKEI